jgi:hypothetical protein
MGVSGWGSAKDVILKRLEGGWKPSRSLALRLKPTDWRPLPLFFVSVASKGFRFPASCLESTLVGAFVSVDFKGDGEFREGWFTTNPSGLSELKCASGETKRTEYGGKAVTPFSSATDRNHTIPHFYLLSSVTL